MRIHISGNAAKENCLKSLAREKGHLISDPDSAELLILSLPRDEITPEEAKCLHPSQKIVYGMVSDAFLSFATARNLRLYPILRDEIYLQANARLTAEGALYATMQQADFALEEASCAVIGFGRIGKALTERLRGLGAYVTVAARRKESREQAGDNSISTEHISELLPRISLLFNTVPSPLLHLSQLKCLRSDAILIELASPPYGIDSAAARELQLNLRLESGLPGRYCPQSAAKAIWDYVERSVLHG